MKCPNCKAENLKGYICTNCGVDTVLFTKTVKISNTLYNKGLSQAKNMDLWGASDSLNKSIDFNKNNFIARNLLGLIYYEIGKIGDALKQWIISASIMKKDNLATTYIDIIQNNEKEMFAKNEAITMYNQALLYVQQKNDDMAIIQLKKSIEINPNMLDSINLLTFCYLIQNKKEEAQLLISKTLQIDAGNLIALNYYKELNGNYPIKPEIKKVEPKQEINKQQGKPTPKPYSYSTKASINNDSKFSDNPNFLKLIYFLCGVVSTFILMYIFIIPNMVSQRDNTITELEHTIATNEVLHEEQLLEANQRILALEEEKERLEDINHTFNTELTIQQKIDAIDEARTLVNTGNSPDAADILYEIDFDILPEDIRNEAETLRTNAYTNAGLSLYNSGLREFNNGNYEESKGLFERSIRYAPEGANYVDDAIYFMGRIAEEEGDIELAITYFRTVIEEYEDSNMFNNATNRLANLETTL